MHDPWLSLVIGLGLGIVIGVSGTLWFFWVIGGLGNPGASSPDDD